MVNGTSVESVPSDVGGGWTCADCGVDISEEDLVMVPIGDHGIVEKASCEKCRAK